MAHNLGLLPLEIIHYILENGPCSNALALARVNSRLHAICRDSDIYSRIIQNHSGKKSLQLLCDSRWWDTVNSYSKTDWQTWARWAWADMQALDQFSQKEDAESHDGKDFWTWLPELLAAGHPLAISICPLLSDSPDARRQLFEIPITTATLPREVEVYANNLTARVIFVVAGACFAKTEIMRREAVASAQEPLSPWDGRHALLKEYFDKHAVCFLEQQIDVFSLDAMEFHGIWGSINLLMNVYDMTTTQRAIENQRDHWTQRMRVCTIMTSILHRHLTVTPVQSTNFSGNWSIDANLPPSMQDIPWQTIYGEIPPPYTFKNVYGTDNRPICDFSSAHIAHMTSKAFLEDGEWIGYYCYTTMPQPTWDPVMRNIKFRVTGDYSDNCTVEGSGRDVIAPFSLNGTIFRNTGWVQLAKQYQPGRRNMWPWSTMMTPFGIVGCWGSQRWGGWVWLWKKAWTVTR